MGEIRVLPDHLANQIAAGEVVERPVSALKELVENAIDAGATDIRVTLKRGGKGRIQVRDNGHGMDPDDCFMALERHATSKLTRAEDLFSIKTLGFRGEALPSIASVSHFTLESVAKDKDYGMRLEVHGGKLTKSTEFGGMPGTTITIDNLFYNIPARRKFLRTVETELSWIVQVMTQYSFVHLDKTFSLENDGRNIFDVRPVKTLKDRIYQHFGKDLLQHLVEVDEENEWLRFNGLFSTPNFLRSSKNQQFIFVNERLVKDKVLSHAIHQAYKGFGEGNRYPSAFLFVSVPPKEVDVNVHPAKTEVKFIQANFVHDRVRDAIRNKLVQRPLSVNYRFRSDYHAVPTEVPKDPIRPQEPTLPQTVDKGPLFQGNAYQNFVERHKDLLEPNATGQVQDQTISQQPPPAYQPPQVVSEEALPGHEDMKPPKIIGQFRDSYILAEQAGSLLLIDQHVLHERLLYDQIVEGLENSSIEKQMLLMPQTVELSPAQATVIQDILPMIRKFGFDIDPFDGSTFVIREVPAFIEDFDATQAITDIAEKVQGLRDETALEAMIDLFAANKACKAAIKINMRLSQEKMEHLVERLWKSSSPMFCPHGRPIILKFTNEEIEKNFHRR